MSNPSTLVLFVGVVLLMLIGRSIYERKLMRRPLGWEAREHDLPRAATYFNELSDTTRTLPERAWTDLDMDDVFRVIDRTVSWPGQHLLYARLRREDHTPDALRLFEAGLHTLAGDESARAQIDRTLRPLDDHRASALPGLFQETLSPRPPGAALFPVLAMLVVASLAGALWYKVLLLVALALVIINTFVRIALRDRIQSVVPAVRMLPTMLKAARTLAALDAPGLAEHADALRQTVPRLQRVAHAAGWLSFDPTGGNELAGYLHEYLNMIFLLDVIAYSVCAEALRSERATIERVYVTLGELDVLQAVAMLRMEERRWTAPEFRESTDEAFSFEGLTHPLLAEPVPVTLDMSVGSVLLTGSNMSGKSTFIRAVGVNAILAGTIHTVFAEFWRSPELAVRTSIGRTDSLLQGKSYYRAEVDAVGALLRERGSQRRLILIDELFRGTNSVERVAAAKAVLAHLDRGTDLVIVATHDVELLDLLPGYAAYHFREEVADGELTFDYRLHSGPSSTKNAIAILALAGFPDDVVADARATARMSASRHSHE